MGREQALEATITYSRNRSKALEHPIRKTTLTSQANPCICPKLMAKSTRSKIKRHFRAKKRETGVYAAHEAARLERLSSKLAAVRDNDQEGDIKVMDAETMDSG